MFRTIENATGTMIVIARSAWKIESVAKISPVSKLPQNHGRRRRSAVVVGVCVVWREMFRWTGERSGRAVVQRVSVVHDACVACV